MKCLCTERGSKESRYIYYGSLWEMDVGDIVSTNKDRQNQRTTMRTMGCSRRPFPSGTGTSKKLNPVGYGNKQQAGSRNAFS